MAEIYITSQELIKTLKISSQELVDIETFFDAHSEDEWELVKGKDYRITVRATGLREYTATGAYTIAKYLEATRKPGFGTFSKNGFCTLSVRFVEHSFASTFLITALL
ncbi:MAG: hypothetical protein HC895_17375 [Leptolyngbyaceae cyanobacterium SM1_3_5]|nr:hypothetical protein [Leptolyngbyaceae cyanobacterium SM1_3_5]